MSISEHASLSALVHRATKNLWSKGGTDALEELLGTIQEALFSTS